MRINRFNGVGRLEYARLQAIIHSRERAYSESNQLRGVKIPASYSELFSSKHADITLVMEAVFSILLTTFLSYRDGVAWAFEGPEYHSKDGREVELEVMLTSHPIVTISQPDQHPTRRKRKRWGSSSRSIEVNLFQDRGFASCNLNLTPFQIRRPTKTTQLV